MIRLKGLLIVLSCIIYVRQYNIDSTLQYRMTILYSVSFVY